MPVVINKKKAVATTSKKMPTGAEVIGHENVESPLEQPGDSPLVAAEPFAMIGCELGFTKNMGDHQFAKFTVRLDLPVKSEDIDEGFKFVSEWVDERMNGLIAESDAANAADFRSSA